jgi:hypothetical protein
VQRCWAESSTCSCVRQELDTRGAGLVAWGRPWAEYTSGIGGHAVIAGLGDLARKRRVLDSGKRASA